jgi:hypothetical protein
MRTFTAEHAEDAERGLWEEKKQRFVFFFNPHYLCVLCALCGEVLSGGSMRAFTAEHAEDF